MQHEKGRDRLERIYDEAIKRIVAAGYSVDPDFHDVLISSYYHRSSKITFPLYDASPVNRMTMSLPGLQFARDKRLRAFGRELADIVITRTRHRAKIASMVAAATASLAPLNNPDGFQKISQVRIQHACVDRKGQIDNLKLSVQIETLDEMLAPAMFELVATTWPSGKTSCHGVKGLTRRAARLTKAGPRTDIEGQLRIDPVLAATLAKAGPEISSALISAVMTAQGTGALTIGKTVLASLLPGLEAQIEHLFFEDGVLHGKIALSENVTWRKGRIFLRNVSMPVQCQQALEGELLARVIVHPLINQPDMRVQKVTTSSAGVLLVDVEHLLLPITVTGWVQGACADQAVTALVA